MTREELEDAWPADEPPRDFAERVVAKIKADGAKPPPKRRGLPLILGLVAAAAAFAVWWGARPASDGQFIAKERSEVAIGNRAVAVLEPGSKIAWHGDEVTEAYGDVFYRVEPRGRFVVKTPAGEVTVQGTCFRVEVGTLAEKGAGPVKKRNLVLAAGGTALAALAIVSVYEGKVQLSHANEKLALGAGESGALDAKGAKRLSAAELDDTREALSDARETPGLAKANDALAKDIAELDGKIKNIEKEKSKLEQELAAAKNELAKQSDAAAPRLRNDFDLDKDDWSELAKDGTVKYRTPCLRPGGWKPDSESLDALGLAPDDADTIQNAYKHSYDRVWKTIRPLCAKAIGNADIVDILGPDTCTHVVVDIARKQDGASVSEAMRELSETRAGLRPDPAGAPQNPVFDVFYALTGEMPAFEAELSQSFGPEEAKRIAFAKEMCGGQSTFGGPGPRKPNK